MKNAIIECFIDNMNLLGKERQPFFFMLDYELKKPFIIPLEQAFENDILYSINGIKNYNQIQLKSQEFIFRKYPIKYELYKKSFDQVLTHIQYGNSFLTNLTFPTDIETNLTMEEIFYQSYSPFRLLFKDQFVVFSPELFVRIRERKISSFPMKGTIDASIADAETILLNDPKETSEHHTITDLIRNDLSIVADDVKVEKFRYIDEVITHDKRLLQVSSEISGILPENWKDNLGSIFAKLLPAGSICGAPKMKTLEIIRDSEICPRGYYTGVFGIFDGQNVESAVMIRFIENTNGKLVYRSGGGITVFSDPEKEYQELIDKVYLPFI